MTSNLSHKAFWVGQSVVATHLIRLSDLDEWLRHIDAPLQTLQVCLLSQNDDLSRAYVFADDLPANMAWAMFPEGYASDRARRLLSVDKPNLAEWTTYPVEQLRYDAEMHYAQILADAILRGDLRVCAPASRFPVFNPEWASGSVEPPIEVVADGKLTMSDGHEIRYDGISKTPRGDKVLYTSGKRFAYLRRAVPRGPRIDHLDYTESAISQESSSRSGRVWTEAEISEIQLLNAEGLSQAKIGERYGVSRERIGQLIRAKKQNRKNASRFPT